MHLHETPVFNTVQETKDNSIGINMDAVAQSVERLEKKVDDLAGHFAETNKLLGLLSAKLA